MVAKSYAKLEQKGEPFTMNGKMYVTVVLKNGATKDVRWYNEAQYRKLYGLVEGATIPKQTKTQKEVLGFEKGYITIYKGATYEDREFFSDSPNARYHKIWKWYTVSTEILPFGIPDHITPIKLPWEMVGSPEGILYDDNTVEQAVNSLLYDVDTSEYQGEVGDRLELEVTVTRVIPMESNYGTANMHIMRDDEHNCYIWITTSKCLNVDTRYNLKGTIKAHKTYKNTRQTILTRCYTRKIGGDE